MERDYNGYNYNTFLAKIFFCLIRVLKSKKKELELTSLYYLSQESWLNDSWKFTYINQSRLYNFFHMGKFKNF